MRAHKQACMQHDHINKAGEQKRGVRHDDDWQRRQWFFRSLVHGLRGTVWFWAEFWTGILLQHSLQSMGVYSMWQGPDGKKHVALGNFSFVLESEKCGCQQRNTVNQMGCIGEAGQTSKAGQFLRHHSTWKRLYSTIWATGSQCSIVKSGET